MKKKTASKKVTKAKLQKKVGSKIDIVSLTEKDYRYWVKFKIKGKLGYNDTSGKGMKDLCANIKSIAKY